MIWDRLEAFSDAMVALIVVEGERVQPLVNHMITSKPADRQQRLSIAFGHLASGNGLALDGPLGQMQRKQFRLNLKWFLEQVRTFMRIK